MFTGELIGMEYLMAQTPSSARDLHDEQIMRNVRIFTDKSEHITDEGFVEDNVSGFERFELKELTLHVDTEPLPEATLLASQLSVRLLCSSSSILFLLLHTQLVLGFI